jgi:hypothetical protein
MMGRQPWTRFIRSTDRTSSERLYETLENTGSIVEFRIAPTGD